MFEQFGSLADVLVWIAVGGGSMWLFGVMKARLLENWVVWHNLPVWIKKIVPIALAGLFGVMAQSLIAVDVTAYIPEGMELILLAVLNWVFGQMEYEMIKNSVYAEGTRIKANGG